MLFNKSNEEAGVFTASAGVQNRKMIFSLCFIGVYQQMSFLLVLRSSSQDLTMQAEHSLGLVNNLGVVGAGLWRHVSNLGVMP